MKLQSRQIDSFLKAPDRKIRAILVYGPDAGLVRERGKILSLTQLADLNDPFNAAHLTGSVIADDPARLPDEANSQSLMGGARLVRVTDAGNEVALPLKNWLTSNPSTDTLVVIEAGDLKPRDPLRKICEDLENAAALPCYVEDERAVANVIRDALRDNGIQIQADALSYLSQAVTGDRSRARMEIEKLVLYLGDQKNAAIADVQQSCGDINLYAIDDFVYSVTGGNKQLALRAFRTLLDEGTDIVGLLRMLQNHVRRLHLVKTLIDSNGQSADEAMKKLQPPIFFKQADLFRAQLNKWPGPSLRRLLQRLCEIEVKAKQTGTAPELLLSSLITEIR